MEAAGPPQPVAQVGPPGGGGGAAPQERTPGSVSFAVFKCKLQRLAAEQKQSAAQVEEGRQKLFRAQESLRAAESAMQSLRSDMCSHADAFDSEKTKLSRQCEEKVRAAEGVATEAQAEARAARRQVDYFRDTIQTLQRERTDTDEQTRELHAEIESLRAQLKDKEMLCSGFEVSFAAITEQILEITEAEASHKKDVEALRETHAALLATCESLKEAARCKAREADENAAARQAAEGQRDDLQAKLAQSEARTSDLEANALVMAAASEASASMVVALRAEREGWLVALRKHRIMLEGLAGEISARESSAKAAHDRCDASMRQNAKLLAELAEERAGREKAEEMAVDFEAENRRLREEAQRLAEAAAEKARALEASELESASLRATRAGLEERVAALESALAEWTARAEAAEARAAAAAAAREAAREALAQRVAESVPRADAAREASEAADAARSEAERAAKEACASLEAQLDALRARAADLQAERERLLAERDALQADLQRARTASPLKPASKAASPCKPSPPSPPAKPPAEAAAKGKCPSSAGAPLAGLKERPSPRPRKGCLAPSKPAAAEADGGRSAAAAEAPAQRRRVAFAADVDATEEVDLEEAEPPAAVAPPAPAAAAGATARACFCGQPNQGLMVSCASCARSFHCSCLSRSGRPLPLGGRLYVCTSCGPGAPAAAAPAAAAAAGSEPFSRKRSSSNDAAAAIPASALLPAGRPGPSDGPKKKQKVARLSF
eukprot:tig00020943_g16254.t1